MEPIPSFAQASQGGNLSQDVANLAPLATTYHGAQTGVSIGQTVNKPPSQGFLPTLASKLGAIGEESAHIVGSVGSWLVKQTAQLVEAPPKLGTSLGNLGMDVYNARSITNQQKELDQRLGTISDQYKSGRISLAGYKVALKEYNEDTTNLLSSEQANQQHLSHDGQTAVQQGINTAATVATIVTGGLASPVAGLGEKAAASFISSSAADASMAEAESALGKLAVNKAVFETLDETTQKAIQDSVSDVVVNGSDNLTTKQVARAMATNLLLKYPISYAALSNTGQQVYTELEQDKYGDAVKTLAFNALLLFSGGPIGKALKAVGVTGSGIKTALFGNSSFLDQLSSLMGDKDPSGLFNAIKDDPELVKSFSALEATNIAAAHGNVTDAVYRVIDGLQNAGWGDIPTLSHEEFAEQVNNWAKAQRLVTEDATARGVPNAESYVVGRWTANDALVVAKGVVQGADNDPEIELENWENLKSQNPNAAWAHNQNLDQEVKSIIKSNENTAQGISHIEAGVGVSGVARGVASKLAKMGYVVIQPKNLEAPFKEGGQISSKFAQNSEFFLKTTSPLPILGSIGSLLTKGGLSPESSQRQMYDLFTANFSRNLEASGVNRFGKDAAENADSISKELANYARNLPKSLKSPPITDYRQMTTSDIQKALGVSRAEAQKIGDALMDSMLQVPLSVRGLGDRLMDLNYKVNPLAGPYARIQGALRFAWNPFFKAKLSYKAEFLSQFESGGKFPTLAGTNKILSMIFPEKYTQLDEIGNTLEREGVFGAGYTDEAANNTQEGKNLGHVILPSQRRSVSGLVSTMADKAGMSVEDFVKNFPDQTRDTVRMILQYDPRSTLLNSPLVRTLNFAFFPFRFNLKVATIMARSLGRTDTLTQFAVIKGMMAGSQFLRSPEGQAWYSQNSDVIGLMKYLTPVATLSEIGQALGQKPESLSQYGELGGLPFGWIPALLNSEGLIDTNQAYVDPKTGVIAQDYVPIGSRGKLNGAIQDLISQLFTYPGATAGLPSKTKIDVAIAGGLVPGSAKDFKKVTPQISPQQQSFQQVVQQNAGTKPVPLSQPSQAPTETVPAQSTPLTTPTSNPASTSSAKKKKADFTPALLPGQTQLGQLP